MTLGGLYVKLKPVIEATVASVTLLGFGFWLGGASAATVEPGSAADPLITKGYLESIIGKFYTKTEVDAKLTNVPTQPGAGGGLTKADLDRAIANLATKAELTNTAKKSDLLVFPTRAEVAALPTTAYVDGKLAFQVVQVEAGHRLIGEAGTEIVLRGGRGTAIGSAQGGMLDSTGGADVTTGTAIAPNHLMIVPRADGRGVAATTGMILMVKGGYRIEAP
jgi:hypothetical protein